MKYELKFWFEHGGTCLWAKNDLAIKKFGYALNNEDLPISLELIVELNELEKQYQTCLDWKCPSSPSPWTSRQKENFQRAANEAYRKLVVELGEEYLIHNALVECIY